MGNKTSNIILNEDEKRIKMLANLLINKLYTLEKIAYNIHIISREININQHMHTKMTEIKIDIDNLIKLINDLAVGNSPH